MYTQFGDTEEHEYMKKHWNAHSWKDEKHQLHSIADDTKKNELDKAENDLSFDIFRASPCTSVVKPSIEGHSTIGAQSITLTQFQSAAEEHKIGEAGANHLTSSEEQAITAEKHEGICITEDTEGNVVTDNGQLLKSTFSDIDHYMMYGSDEFKTLEEALKYFHLYSRLEELDNILEDVRRHRKTENDYKECFKQFDKDMTKLSLTFHPDIVQRRGGTENEMKIAQKLQTALNAVKKVLSYLNAAFLADIHTDHRFQFYSKLKISSLFSEKDVKCRIYETRLKLSTISRIKQQNIILEIRYFLNESKKCVSKFLRGKKAEFKNLCDSVMFRLHQCIKGFKTLCAELELMENKCIFCNDEHMFSFVQNMKENVKRNLELLERLEKSATSSMQENYDFFSTGEFIDPYFVYPLVWYTNVIVMCKVMSKSFSLWDKFKFSKYYLKHIYYPELYVFCELEPLYYLTAYCSGGKMYEHKVKSILNNEYFSLDWYNAERCKIEIITKFCEILSSINKVAESKFNVDHYTEIMTGDFFAVEIEKCMSMMNEFHKKEQELTENLNEIRIQTGISGKNYDNILETSEKLDSKIDEMVDLNSKIEAKFDSSCSKIEELIQMSKKLPKKFQ